MARCAKAIEGGAGVVHIVKNYTSEVMNFKLAAEDAAPIGGAERASERVVIKASAPQ